MKKVLWSAAVALMILTLTGCAGTAGPAPAKDFPTQTIVENVPKSHTLVEKKKVAFSAAEAPLPEGDVENEGTDVSTKTEPPVQSAPIPVPQEPPAPVPVQPVVTPEPAVQESPSPAPSMVTEPEITQAPDEPDPPAEPEPSAPAFSIDHWITYAQDHARGAGLNLNPTAVDCWDNPITAGAHCLYLERDIQSRLSRYAKDDTILDVWIWAEGRSDGSYDLYIGYA